MPALERRIQLLASLPAADQARFLADSLSHAHPEERAELMRALVALPVAEAQRQVVHRFHELLVVERDIVVRAPAAFERGLRLALTARDRRCVLNAFEVVVLRRDASCVDLLIDHCTSADAEVSERAAEVLLELVGALPRGGSASRRADRIAGMLLRAAGRSELPVAAALAAAIHLPHGGNATRAALADESVAVAALAQLRRAVSQSRHPHVESNLITWLVEPSLAPSALRRIENMRNPEAWTRFLSTAHRLRLPACRAAIRKAPRPLKLLPGLALVADLPPRAQQGYLDVLLALELSIAIRRDRLRDAGSLTDRPARSTAAAALKRLDEGSRSASVPAEPEAAVPLAPAIARMHDDRAHIERFISNIEVHTPAARRVLGAYHAARSPTAFVRQCRRLLRDGTTLERMHAIELLDRNQRAGEAELELLLLAASENSRLAARAIAAIGRLDSPAAGRALAAAMRHPDARVRADAVEALARRGDRTAAAIIEPLVESRSPRLRANAIDALRRFITSDRADDHLERMLTDPDPRHRRSAVWVAARAESEVGRPALMEVASGDVDSVVRHAARRALRRVRPAPSQREATT